MWENNDFHLILHFHNNSANVKASGKQFATSKQSDSYLLAPDITRGELCYYFTRVYLEMNWKLASSGDARDL